MWAFMRPQPKGVLRYARLDTLEVGQVFQLPGRQRGLFVHARLGMGGRGQREMFGDDRVPEGLQNLILCMRVRVTTGEVRFKYLDRYADVAVLEGYEMGVYTDVAYPIEKETL